MVDQVLNGKVIGTEMRYLAETEDMERDGPKDAIEDWDSLSDRLRRQRRLQKSIVQRQRGKFYDTHQILLRNKFANYFCSQKQQHSLTELMHLLNDL